MRLEVVRTGLPVLVQDLGRTGLAAVGVGRSGAADRGAYLLGNRLLHNDNGEAALEITFGSAEFALHRSMTLTLTGAHAPARLDGVPVPYCAPFHARAGQRLSLDAPTSGLRSYLCVRGGIVVQPVLGSCASDTLSGVGPAPLAAGDSVEVGNAPPDWHPRVDVAPVPTPSGGLLTLPLTPGPRNDWLADFTALLQTTWTVSTDSDRVGMRLDGPALARHPEFEGVELPSEGVVRGSIQVPTGGQPVVFGADHPVTGGYPVVAVLTDVAADRAAQARPGQQLRFTKESS